MAVNRGPVLKRCRALGLEPAFLGYDKKSNRNSRKTANKKVSEYGLQLKEKQKAKFIYGVLEKPFRNLYNKAERMSGKTGDNLVKLLEFRFDNIVYRMGFAASRAQARQLVNHGHFTVNGKKANIPSMTMKVGDEIAVSAKGKETKAFENIKKVTVPTWLSVDEDAMKGKIVVAPERADLDLGDLNETLIVELYSK
ncbi:MAG: 30S ribosomal protein S4 [Saccharofermentanaceae bacterium]|jgi:small subunit ribosomal protein S4|nr:30S ribosomal protein S4 [Clostridia bacterium]HPG63778.1 30S ribosomal protein S4 [Saccharofermentans sp.]HPM74404.1 30S ribosomal protein S4 [Saccharofermentans sp.]HUM23735.1 30S ribosomal protein S4 [Saccharofermentans sp.]